MIPNNEFTILKLDNLVKKQLFFVFPGLGREDGKNFFLGQGEKTAFLGKKREKVRLAK